MTESPGTASHSSPHEEWYRAFNEPPPPSFHLSTFNAEAQLCLQRKGKSNLSSSVEYNKYCEVAIQESPKLLAAAGPKS